MPSNRKVSSGSSSKADLVKKEETTEEVSDGGEAVLTVEAHTGHSQSPPSKKSRRHVEEEEEDDCRFLGEPVPDDEARRRWPHRYKGKEEKDIAGSKSSKCNADSEEIIQARCHYTKAEVDGRVIFNLGDDAHVKAIEGEEDYTCKIIEMFVTTEGSLYFMAQWYYRAKDTVIKSSYCLIDDKRVFFSEVKDDNPLNCLVEKLKIVQLPLNTIQELKENQIPQSQVRLMLLA